MKIAVISDIHDNLMNLEKALAFLKDWGAEQLICCGDVCNIDTAKYLAGNFPGMIHLVKGTELFNEKELDGLENIKYYGKIAVVEIDKYLTGICHEPRLIDSIIRAATNGVHSNENKKNNCEIIFYGHTHKPWIEKRNGVQIVNPGTVAGVFQKASFAVWDTEDGSLELKILDNL